MIKFLVALGFVIVVILGIAAVQQALALEPLVKEGDRAPDFELEDQHGKPVRLSEFRGENWVVLYFYPKDDTPGCTKEACSFRDNLLQLQSLNAVVLGVSVDDVRSHRRFSEKNNLNFSILSDTSHQVCKQYGTLTSFMGLKLAHRSTFIIDPDGMVRKVFPRVEPQDHGIEVAMVLKELQRED